MPRFILEKLPPHWLFVPSKRQVRELLAELDADVRWVEFYGTAYGRSTDRLSIGFVESRVVEGSWCFYLHLWGVRESVAGPVREALAAAALAEIGQYVRTCASAPPSDVVKPAQLSLSFRIGPDELQSESQVKAVSKYTFSSRRSWWAKTATAAPDAASDNGGK
jgi:hypothetical protein